MMTDTASRRCSTVTYTTPSHIAELPYEHRREVVTSYEDNRTDTTAWNDLPKDERDVWSDWLDRMHAQQCRLAEMHLDELESAELMHLTDEWEDQPSHMETILDEIEARRSVESTR